MSEWQPISTAPRDGTLVDISHEGVRFTDVYYLREALTIKGVTYAAWCKENGEVTVIEGFHTGQTHWMPIPPPPSTPTDPA